MTYLQAIILGIVQGLGEFVPISSSAHLILVPYLAGWPAHMLTFDVALHLGTLLALLAFFGRDIVHITRAGFNFQKKNGEQRLLWYILLGSVPAALIGFVFENTIEHLFRSAIPLIAIVLGVTGLVLWYVDTIGSKDRPVGSLSWLDVLAIGFAQTLALFPGVSRSGATMSAGLLLGLTREAAARFSFLLSVPIVFGAALVSMRHLHLADISGPFIAGIATAGVVGYVSIGWLLRFLQKGSLATFAWYRLVVALLVLGVVMVRHG